jgi:SWI/SNF-related matrix-associated actin-dependent regulator 1 of chromatin subfamily A
MKEYKEAERDIIKYLVKYQDADDEKIQRTIRGAIMVKMGLLKQISARGKVKGAVDIIHNVIDGDEGQKLIVFCYLKEVVQALKAEFRQAVTVTGEDSPAQEQYAVDRFQNDESVRLIILNYKSGGVGLTLTAASNVLFVEFPWTAADCSQAEDRAHRNGQKNAVTCTYLLGSGTIDEYMFNLIQTKKEISKGMLRNHPKCSNSARMGATMGSVISVVKSRMGLSSRMGNQERIARTNIQTCKANSSASAVLATMITNRSMHFSPFKAL